MNSSQLVFQTLKKQGYTIFKDTSITPVSTGQPLLVIIGKAAPSPGGLTQPCAFFNTTDQSLTFLQDDGTFA